MLGKKEYKTTKEQFINEVELIGELRMSKDTWQEIADWLNERGYTKVDGDPFTA